MHRRGYTTQLWVSTRGSEPTRFSNIPNLIGERTSNFVTPSGGRRGAYYIYWHPTNVEAGLVPEKKFDGRGGGSSLAGSLAAKFL